MFQGPSRWLVGTSSPAGRGVSESRPARSQVGQCALARGKFFSEIARFAVLTVDFLFLNGLEIQDTSGCDSTDMASASAPGPDTGRPVRALRSQRLGVESTSGPRPSRPRVMQSDRIQTALRELCCYSPLPPVID